MSSVIGLYRIVVLRSTLQHAGCVPRQAHPSTDRQPAVSCTNFTHTISSIEFAKRGAQCGKYTAIICKTFTRSGLNRAAALAWQSQDALQKTQAHPAAYQCLGQEPVALSSTQFDSQAAMETSCDIGRVSRESNTNVILKERC